MTEFNSAREAKEFLVARIVEEAKREGIPLSEVERKMLYFTETGWAPPDIMATNDEFDRDYDQEHYEAKIAQLIRNARKADAQSRDVWLDAIRVLSKEDHYLSVMIELKTKQERAVEHPRFDRLKLWGTALALVTAVLGVVYVGNRLGITIPVASKESRSVFLWLAALSALGAYYIYRMVAVLLRSKREKRRPRPPST